MDIQDTISKMTPEGYELAGSWTYPDEAGAFLMEVARYDAKDANGKRPKQYRPFISDGNGGFVSKFPDPRPLYNLDKLAAKPHAAVMIVEGEKTAEAASKLLPDYVFTTSAGGSLSAKSTDWSILKERDVYIFPDADKGGKRYAVALAELLPQAKIVPLASWFPEKWDLADPLPEGKTIDDIKLLIAFAGPYEKNTVIPFPAKNRAAGGAAAMLDATAEALGNKVELVYPPGEPMPNSRQFLASEYAHPEHCRLVHQGGQFYRWDGTCWPAIEDPILRSELYRWFEAKRYVEGLLLKPFAPTARKVADLMDTTRAITIISTKQATPSWLVEAGHQANEVISCENGLVHWPTRTMTEHRPGYYVHHSVPFAFDAAAPAPERWLAFLNELWPDDPTTIHALQEMFGYLVSGDTRQQKMFLFVGPKRGGKGTIGRVLARMIGRHNVAGPTLASLGTNFGLQDLIGKPVAVISDARLGNKSDHSLIAERLLSVSGEDLQNVDRKYLPPWSGYLPTRFVVLTNELPRFTDSSGALASRFVVLMLNKSFYNRENPALTDELCKELPGIFNWALDGLQSLRARGRFQQPSSSADAIREMEDLASPVGAFLRDKCKFGHDLEIAVEALYKSYRLWCEDNGRPASNSATFGRDLRAAKPGLKVVRHRPARNRYYIGVALGTPWTEDADEEASTASTEDIPCTTGASCTACDGNFGRGCPTCKPENYGLPKRRT